MRRPAQSLLCCTLLLAAPSVAAPQQPETVQNRISEVPLSLWTHSNWPSGFNFGPATGPSFVDFDRDGWPDLFAHESAQLWRNLDGLDWALAADLDSVLPAAGGRYGSAWGDWDQDGLPDLATEPRAYGQDDCLHLLHNDGGGAFTDVAGDPNVLDLQPCGALAESNNWADFDGDGDLDLFIPNYPPNEGSDGNHFLHNLGPSGALGATRFASKANAVGLAIPTNSARPEGTQVLDIDRDGDLDLYSNGVLYQNRSAFDAPDFNWIGTGGSGIGLRSIVDEGTVFLDHDQDGDYDLLMSYTFNRGMRLWENYGDGTFVQAPLDLIEDYQTGAGFALSAADWDGDGDLDFMALNSFRRNMFQETGRPGFELAKHQISPGLIANATSAWADWDKDGDLDLAVGNGRNGSFLFQNDLYDANTGLAQKRHLRVHVLRDSASVANGLETEFGASVEIRARNHSKPWRQQQFVSSASGYINQNEYALTFHLPADPVPGDPRAGVRFEIAVDFPSLPEIGYHRVDKSVNAALGNLDLELLGDREIYIYRSGKVVLGGAELLAEDPAAALLQTSGGGLIQPERFKGLSAPTTAAADEWVGIELDTINASGPLQLREVVLDGVPAVPIHTWGRSGNLALWDVSAPASPKLAADGIATLRLRPGNRRGHYPVSMTLQPNRIYRLVVKVDSWRTTPVSAPVSHGFFDLSGGLRYVDGNPASGQGVVAAGLDPSTVYLAARLAEQSGREWKSLDYGASSGAAPVVSISGQPVAGARIEMSIDGAPAAAAVHVVAGTRLRFTYSAGLEIVPDAGLRLGSVTTDAQGHALVTYLMPQLEAGTPVYVQAFVEDGSASGGALSSEVLSNLIHPN